MPFIAEELALAFIRALRPIVAQIRQHDRNLEAQIKDAASSAALNLSEGRRRDGKDRMNHWRIADGSASEARSGLRVAVAWGYVAEESLGDALARGDELCAVTWRLAHPVPRGGPARGR